MKNILTFISTIILILVISTNLLAQDAKVFTGTIVYKMEALGTLSVAEKAQIEGTVTTTYGIGVYKTVTTNIMMNLTQIIYEDSVISIYDMMGQQYAFRMTKEEAESMEKSKDSTSISNSKVNIINETKDIVGFTCQKAEIEMGDDILEIYYNKDYKISDFMKEDNMSKIDGLPLEYTIPLNAEISIHMIATSIKKKKKVKASEFEIPAGVKVMSFEEMQAMMGG